MKRLCLLFALLCMTTYVSAGIIPEFRFGLKAGLDYQANDLSSALNTLNIRSNTGWTAGVMAELNWGKLGIHPEVVYSRNSFTLSGADGKLKTSQVEVPVLLNYKVLGILKLQAGPRFCVMDDASGASNQVDWHIKTPTVGYAIGVEATVWKLALSARYNGAFNRTEVLGFTTGKNKQSNLQLSVGYYF